MNYHHIQNAPMYWILIVVAAAILTAGISIDESTVQVIMYSVGGLMLLFAASFRHLEVADEGDALLVSFGPLPLFRRRVQYDNIESVSRARSTFLDGWGIHMSPSGGWVWNLWGYDCVDIRMKRGPKLRLGTDDLEALVVFLESRVAKAE